MNAAQLAKSIGPKLVPFFKTVTIYFVVFLPQDTPSILATVLKVLPILSLILFIFLYGVSFSNEHKYTRKILTGLALCSIGDACLIWPNCFEIGMVFFALGHLNYISAFGCKSDNLGLGAGLFILNTIGILYLKSGFDEILMIGVPIYTLVLITMLWRALSRVQKYEDLRNFGKVSAAVGAILFVLSDLIIGIDRFKTPLQYAQVLVMSTYYAAQLGITLSVVDSSAQNKKLK